MLHIQIIPATIHDLAEIQEISRRTFHETFAAVNTAANMKIYLEEELSVDKLRAELIDPNTEWYMAMHDQVVIGYLKLNSGKAQTVLQDPNALEIERIYVLKDYHGKQVGQLLYNKAKQIASTKGATYIWLGVWEHNPRAIQFYQKNGFVAFDQHVFKLGNDEQTDIMMKLTPELVNE